jgi:hypothetical protein
MVIIERNQKISELEQSSFFLLQISENKLHEETISENRYLNAVKS